MSGPFGPCQLLTNDKLDDWLARYDTNNDQNVCFALSVRIAPAASRKVPFALNTAVEHDVHTHQYHELGQIKKAWTTQVSVCYTTYMLFITIEHRVGSMLP